MLTHKISQLSQHPAIKNTGWMIGEKIASMALVLLINILIARHLGPQKFGLLNYAIAIFTIIMPLSAIGFNAIVTRELVKNKVPEITVMSTALVFRFFGGLIAFLGIIVAVQFNLFKQLSNYSWAIILLSLVNIFSALHVIEFWFQAKVQAKYVVIARFIVTLVFCVFKALLVYFSASLEQFMIVVIAEYLAICLGFLLVYFQKGGRLNLFSVDFSYGMKLLKQSYWLILSGIASVIYLKIDQVMLAEMVSPSETGIYSVASRISEVWYFFATALVTSFFPALIRSKEADTGQYNKSLQKLNDTLLISAFILAVFIFFTGDMIIQLLFGQAYIGAGQILIIHIWASLFVFMRALLSKWLIAENLIQFSLVTHGVGAIVNVALNLVFIPEFKGEGAAYATVISYAVASYFSLFFHSSTRVMAAIMTRSLFFPFRLFLSKVKFAG